MIDYGSQRQTRRCYLETIGRCASVALDIYAECTTATLDCLIPATLGQTEYFWHFGLYLPIGDFVDELRDDACTLFHLVHAHFESSHGIAFGADDFVKLYFVIHGIGSRLAHIASPA